MRFKTPFLLVLLAITAAVTGGCASQGVQLEESQLLRVFESKSGLIAYLGADGNLYTVNQAGESRVQITDDTEGIPIELAHNFRLFAWSAAANDLAYTGISPEAWTVHVLSEGETEPVDLHREDMANPIFLKFTPDGEEVAFLTYRFPSGSDSPSRMDLWSVPAKGGSPARELAGGFPLFFSSEPAGDRAVIHIGGSGTVNPEAEISIVTPGSDFVRNLEMPPATFQTPAWSPDGTELLMAIRDVQGRNALVTVSLQGQVRQTITTFENAIAFTWSPDGRYVAYITSDRSRQGVSGPLTVIDPATYDEVFVSEEQTVHAFFWSPDSKEIVYFTEELTLNENSDTAFYGFGLSFVNLKDREVRQIRLGSNPFLFDPTPQFHSFLAAFDQYAQNATIWSPNQEYIVLPALTADGQGIIMVIATSGSLEPRPIAEGLMALWSWK